MTEAEKNEFHRPVQIKNVGSTTKTGELNASEKECAALARRFSLPSIENLTARYAIGRDGEHIVFEGQLQSRLEQICALSGDPFPVAVSEDFKIIFADPAGSEAEEEIELDADDCDMMDISDGIVDLGEAVAQTLYLALDPYPRGPNAKTMGEESALLSEDEAGPFGALAKLKKNH